MLLQGERGVGFKEIVSHLRTAGRPTGHVARMDWHAAVSSESTTMPSLDSATETPDLIEKGSLLEATTLCAVADSAFVSTSAVFHFDFSVGLQLACRFELDQPHRPRAASSNAFYKTVRW